MTRIQTVKLFSALALVVGLTGGLIAEGVSAAEPISALSGLKPMSDSELAANTGGFTLPNGLNLDVGFIVNSAVQSALGNLQVTTTFSSSSGPVGSMTTTVQSNGQTTTSNGPVLASLPGNGGSTTISENGLTATISNTANGVNINQSKTVTINIGNYYATMNPSLGAQLLQLRLQANWTHGLH